MLLVMDMIGLAERPAVRPLVAIAFGGSKEATKLRGLLQPLLSSLYQC